MTAPANPRISVVVPARNEQHYLPRLLDTLERARASYHDGAEAIEVIVADNASTDDTAQIAERYGCRVQRVERRSIAATRNGGARGARGDVLCFVDADMQVHPETFNAIDRAVGFDRVLGGATGVTLERWSPGLWLTYVLMVPMIWILGIDTGVVFCRREAFETVGGYDERLRIAEDVRFLFDLKRLGWKRRQRLVRLRPVKAVASTRKFDRHGDWHYITGAPRVLFWLMFSRRSLDAFVDGYWYGDQR